MYLKKTRVVIKCHDITNFMGMDKEKKDRNRQRGL